MNDSLLHVSCAGLDNLQVPGEDVIYYDLVNDTTQTISLVFDQGMFTNNWLSVKVTLPEYGFQFADMLADLNDQTQIRNAKFTKRNGYDAILTFDLYGTPSTHHNLELYTKYAPLTANQCNTAINGWTPSSLKVEVTNAGGTEIASIDSTPVQPKEGTTEGVYTIEPFEWMVAGNKYTYDGAQEFGWTDKFTMKIRVAGGSDNTSLVRLDEFKLYIPGNEKNLELCGYTGNNLNTQNLWVSKYFECDYTRHPDAGDGKGDYYLFTALPGTALYNSGSLDKTETVILETQFKWKMKDFDENGNEVCHLNSNPEITRYESSPTELSYTTTGNREEVAYGPGHVLLTPAVQRSDGYGFAYQNLYVNGYGHYRKEDEASKWKAVPGASYTNVVFVPVYNDNYYSSSRKIDYRGPDGDVTEIYDFPYEVQPTFIKLGAEFQAYQEVTSVKVTITSASGVESPPLELLSSKLVMTENDTYDLDLRDLIADGGRVSKVEIERGRFWATGGAGYGLNGGRGVVYAKFHYAITHNDEEGNPLEDGQLLKIGYTGKFNQEGYQRTFGDTAQFGADNYLYLQVEEKKCPWLMSYLKVPGLVNPHDKPIDYTSDYDELFCSAIYLKGESGGSYRDYIDDPVIDLSVSATRDSGFTGDQWIALLSPSMTLTKNMSNWQINYSLRNIKTGEERNNLVYDIGPLDGDRELTGHDLQMGEDECFTAFSVSHNGRFTYQETTESTQEQRYGQDDSPPGTYDLAFLLKDLKVRPRATGIDGVRLLGPNRLKLIATLRHGPDSIDCDREKHSVGESARYGLANVDRNQPYRDFYSDYEFAINGPNFSAAAEEASVHQGGTIISDLTFRLIYTYVKDPEAPQGYTSDFSKKLPSSGVRDSV